MSNAIGSLSASLVKLLSERRVLCLSTATDNVPYSTPVFYYFNREVIEFYFISSLDSHHLKQASNNHNVSAAIFDQNPTIQEIKGAQIQGWLTIEPIDKIKNNESFTNYKATIIESSEFLNIANLSFCTLKANQIKFIDNSVKFGYKEVWSRS